MSQYKISKARLKEIIKEEYEAAMARTDEGHGAFGIANRDEEPEAEEKEEKKEDEKVDEAHCGSANRDEELDPVGEEDKDINNDRKVDSTDKYLKNRRKAIGKAINKESLDSIRALIQQELKNL